MGISMAGLCALFVVALSRPAAACGALESAWWSFQTPVPASGSTAVALDGAFVLRVQPFARVVPARSIAELLTRSFNDPETVEVRLRDSAGALWPGICGPSAASTIRPRCSCPGCPCKRAAPTG
jgi:hypothetical protein